MGRTLIFSVCSVLLVGTLRAEPPSDELPPVCANTEEGSCLLPAVPRDCRLVMAPESDTSWGVFTLVDRPRRGSPLLPGDLVIQVTDLDQNPYVDEALLERYFWSAEETGGFYEGKHVVSAVPGVGMLARGSGSTRRNVLPFVPSVDEAGLTRKSSPGAGAITHYHNFTFYVQTPMKAGDQVFWNSQLWLEEDAPSTEEPASNRRHVEWLRQNGYCLDSIRPGRSKIEHAGRGAFASRLLPPGSIVAPVPVLAIPDRRALDFSPRKKKDGLNKQQLLLNYCFGHAESSVLLFPTGPGVNWINHGGGKYANVKLQWAQSTTPNASLTELSQKTFLLELVALREIKPTEEILLDYGTDWIEAWIKHVQSWKPNDEEPYVPSYVQDDVVRSLRTTEELEQHSYPDNVFTSCFYRYSDNANDKTQTSSSSSDSTTTATTSVRWQQTRGIFELQNLRPCKVLQRQTDPQLGTVYTVQIRNRLGLPSTERLSSSGTYHIVTHLPRRAIRFSDKRYTTDQHLEQAFRHEIRVADDLFPEQWKDRKEDAEVSQLPAIENA